MPVYLFLNESDGKIEEVFQPMSECVPIGETREIDGKKLRRLPSYGAAMVEPDYAHMSWQFEPDLPYAPRVDPVTRQPILLNKKEILNFEAKHREATEGLQDFRYDFGIHRS